MKMALRTSNLGLPQGFVEMDCEEMMYVDGGLTLSSKGLYFSYEDVSIITMLVGTNVYAVAVAMSTLASWMCSSGIGAVIWGLFTLSSVYVAAKALQALIERKGLLLSVEYAKFWFVRVPVGLNLDVK